MELILLLLRKPQEQRKTKGTGTNFRSSDLFLMMMLIEPTRGKEIARKSYALITFILLTEIPLRLKAKEKYFYNFYLYFILNKIKIALK